MAEKKVLPGDFLSTEEEFEPGTNTFEADGDILSDSVGKAIEDTKSKTVTVEKAKDLHSIGVGDVVYGRVILVKENSVILDLMIEKGENSRTALRHFSAALFVRNVSRDFVKDLSEMFKLGDIVKAKVATLNPYGMDVRTNDSDLGVVKSFCSKCRKPLHLFDAQLKCIGCGNTETRKVSKDYLWK